MSSSEPASSRTTDENGNSSSPEINEPRPRGRRRRTPRAYPVTSFEEALELAQHIQQYATGKRVRRLTLLDHHGRSETSRSTRQWITEASKYGVIEGSYNSEYLVLTDEGYRASSDELPTAEVVQARFRLAITNIAPFQTLYEEYAGDKLPLAQILADTLRRHKIDDQIVDRLVQIFLVNLKYLGLLKTVADAERILTIEHRLEGLPQQIAQGGGKKASAASRGPQGVRAFEERMPGATHSNAEDELALETPSFADQQYDQVCFYITPIGDPETDIRRHVDLFLEHLVKPALSAFHLTVICADQIDKPGLITRQIIDYLLRSRLVIADLSFHNPNVFYELALRHARRLPTVQIIRSDNPIPFDERQSRTIRIDCTNIFTLVPKLETYRAEIANQVRRALENPDVVDNPLSTFYPSLKTTI